MSTAEQNRQPTAAPFVQGAHLFSPLTLRDVTLRNRIMVSPMCQYSSIDGLANEWHLVHLGGRAVGGAGLVMVEATAVTANGRISPYDMGLWNDAQIEPLARVARFISGQGSVPGIQIGHAGRKASSGRPWEGGGSLREEEGAWTTVGPSAVPFGDRPPPRALDQPGIREVIDHFRQTAERALLAGFQVVELHAAHGYLIHEFLSPLSNFRDDEYGGIFANRVRFLLEIVDAVRSVWPQHLPLFTRLSATDWREDGWTVEDSVALARLLAPRGVDLIDCSSGGILPGAAIPVGPGYQVPFAAQIRAATSIPTAAVGLITEPNEAQAIIQGGEADLVALARAELRDPYWPVHAARVLGHSIAWPPQYERARD